MGYDDNGSFMGVNPTKYQTGDESGRFVLNRYRCIGCCTCTILIIIGGLLGFFLYPRKPAFHYVSTDVAFNTVDANVTDIIITQTYKIENTNWYSMITQDFGSLSLTSGNYSGYQFKSSGSTLFSKSYPEYAVDGRNSKSFSLDYYSSASKNNAVIFQTKCKSTTGVDISTNGYFNAETSIHQPFEVDYDKTINHVCST